MAQYRERPRLVEADQWFRNGDHPKDGRQRIKGGDQDGMLMEGKVVRYFRDPSVPGGSLCANCNRSMHRHGWIDSGGAGQAVCPGDYIVTQEDGTYLAVHADEFKARFTKDHEHA